MLSFGGVEAANGAKEGGAENNGGAAGFVSCVVSGITGAGAGFATVGGAIVTPGFEKTAELAKKLGMAGVAGAEAAEVSSTGLGGAGLGGTSAIDGIGGDKGVGWATFATLGGSGVFGTGSSVGAGAGMKLLVTGLLGSPKEKGGARLEGAGVVEGFANENGSAAIGGSLALLESCKTGAFCMRTPKSPVRIVLRKRD